MKFALIDVKAQKVQDFLLNAYNINNWKLDDLYSLLDDWVKIALYLEKTYKDRIIDLSNIDFLLKIGKSVYILNTINSILIANIEKNVNNIEKNLDNKEELNNLTKFWRFFNSLIASKVKHFFFRELPVVNINYPFLDLDFELADSAYKIISLSAKILKQNKNNLDKLAALLFKNFFYQSLYYAFIYNLHENRGAFLRFKYNKKHFLNISKQLSKLIRFNSEENLRLFTSNYLCWLVTYYLDQKNIKLEDIEKPKCYQFLFEKIKDDNLFLEPFTYHLADIIWKLDGMIQDDDEVVENSSNQNDLIQIVNKFINHFLKEADKVYRYNRINFYNFYRIESNFVKDIYDLLLPEKKREDITKCFLNLNQRKSFSKKLQKEHEKICDLFELISNLRTRGEKGLKLESLLEDIDINIFISLVSAFAKLIVENLFDKKIAFVGFYKSGVFLAHLINWIFGTNHFIWLFKTKPYVATHPIHEEDTKKIFTSKILLFDESIKTAFTYSLYESYLKRNLFTHNHAIKLYSLFDFTKYKKIIKLDYTSLYQLDKDLFPINRNILEVLTKTTNKLNFSLDQISRTSKEQMNIIIKEIAHKFKKDHKFDFTYLLTNSFVSWQIAYLFAEKILNYLSVSTQNVSTQNVSTKKIYIFSPSGEGEILSLLTTFILKLLNSDLKICFLDKGEVINWPLSQDDYLIAIDLSLITGFSLAYNWSIAKEGKYSPSQKINLLSDFHLICTICSSAKATKSEKDNVYCLIDIEELENICGK